jgi:hypothetical protein
MSSSSLRWLKSVKKRSPASRIVPASQWTLAVAEGRTEGATTAEQLTSMNPDSVAPVNEIRKLVITRSTGAAISRFHKGFVSATC